MTLEQDIDSIIDGIPAAHSGVYRLWLAVTLHAVFTLTARDGRHVGSARLFLFDEDNQFLEAVCDGLGISPEAFRERAQKLGLTELCIHRHGNGR